MYHLREFIVASMYSVVIFVDRVTDLEFNCGEGGLLGSWVHVFKSRGEVYQPQVIEAG